MKNLDVVKIFESMKANDISEFIVKEGSKLYEIRRGGFKQRIFAGGNQPVVQNMPQAAHVIPPIVQQQPISPTAQTGEKDTPLEAKEKGDKYYEVRSPLVGTFYASPKPDASPFVEVGTKIKKGQTLCMVEAMKNFNEIESEVEGVIKEVCVNNGELVEFGKILFKVELNK
ncbi:MAG: acetyl-CoA carboxylase biotin carboxyl carrier protein [Spirochaetes bacterium]|nr:acetyl-CoA carboxylase biotin carboxyl carrier protein [Spirochaetota bacterium]